VTRARVAVAGEVSGEIGRGFVALVGATHGDGPAEADWLARKVAALRLFPDGEGQMNRALAEVGGAVLAVPQFTLYGDGHQGRRPDFVRAARPEVAAPLFERFCETLAATGTPVARGVFRAHMQVELVNDGPVTLLLEREAAPAAPA